MRGSEYTITTSVTDPKGNMHIILVDNSERVFIPVFVKADYVLFLQRSMETDEEIDLAAFWQFQMQSWAVMGFEPEGLIIDYTAENGMTCFCTFSTKQESPMKAFTTFMIPIPVAFILAYHFDFNLYLTDRAQTFIAAFAMTELEEFIRSVSQGEGTYGGMI